MSSLQPMFYWVLVVFESHSRVSLAQVYSLTLHG